MNKKLLSALTEKCKSFGLTKKAIEEIAELTSSTIKDDASDEDIAEKADSLVPFAKAMQAEITRKTRKSSANKPSDDEGNGEDASGNDAPPQWAKAFEERLNALETENTQLKAEKAKSERASLIADAGKKLGIPDFMLKRLRIDDDADIEKEVAAFKQDLVNNSLMPKEQAHETGDTSAADKAAAQSWAKALPDNNLL